MKRLLVAFAALLGFAHLATANYLVFKVDLNKVIKDPMSLLPGKINPGMQPGDFGEGGPGFPGDPGEGGAGGAGPGIPGGRGGAGMGGGFGGYPGGGGLRGGAGGGPQVPGGPGMPGDPNDPNQEAEPLPPLWAYASVELSKHRVLSGAWEVEHRWGKQNFIPVTVSRVVRKEPPAKEYGVRYKKVVRDAKQPHHLKDLKDLAGWALYRGLLKEFHGLMDELKLKAHKQDPVVMAYLKVRANMQKSVSEDPLLKSLLDDLREANWTEIVSERRDKPYSQGGHYGLFYLRDPDRPVPEADLRRRLERMEANYETFYYWFVLQGIDLPVPERRLLAILERNSGMFADKHHNWGGASVPNLFPADGFTPRRDNVMILSNKPRDEVYTMLEKINSAWQNKEMAVLVTRDDLLSGKIWKKPGAAQEPEQVIILQTLALLQKALEEDAERTAISHEGTRQLLAASGLIPRGVQAPDWVQYGLASFFETPRRAFYTSVGLPSWTNLVQFKHLRKNKKLESAEDAFTNVVTNGYFRRANHSLSKLKDRKDRRDSPLAEKAKEEREIAQATSWALVYYLAKNNKLDRLLRYCEELSGLPRDLDFDDGALKGVFERAFQIRDVNDFATKWFLEMDNITLELPDMEQELLRALEPPPPPTRPANPAGGPGFPGFPGPGAPGAPGGRGG